MDDLGFNKIAGAILGTALGVMILMKLPTIFMHDEGDAIVYSVGEIGAPPEAGNAEPLPFPQADWVSAMDEVRGAKVFKKCTSCHNVEPGGANGTGPALYGVVGNDKAVGDGFSYSSALTGLGGKWTYEDLDAFLTKPSTYAKGTKMNFIGLKKAEDRAAVIEYMRVNGSPDLARPEPAAAEVETMVGKDDAMVDKMNATPDAPETMIKDNETMVKDGADVMVKEDGADTMVKEAETMIKDSTDAMVKDTDTMIKDGSDAMIKDTETMVKDGADTMIKEAETTVSDTMIKDGADTMIKDAETMVNDKVDTMVKDGEAMIKDEAETMIKDKAEDIIKDGVDKLKE